MNIPISDDSEPKLSFLRCRTKPEQDLGIWNHLGVVVNWLLGACKMHLGKLLGACKLDLGKHLGKLLGACKIHL
jgi:hypothetical protein